MKINRTLSDKEVEKIREMWKELALKSLHKEADFRFYTYSSINLLDDMSTYVTSHEGYIADKQESFDLLYASDSLAHCILLAWNSLSKQMKKILKEGPSEEGWEVDQYEQAVYYSYHNREMQSYFKRLSRSIKKYQKEYKKDFIERVKSER